MERSFDTFLITLGARVPVFDRRVNLFSFKSILSSIIRFIFRRSRGKSVLIISVTIVYGKISWARYVRGIVTLVTHPPRSSSSLVRFTFHLERACIHSDGCFYRYRRWPHVCNRLSRCGLRRRRGEAQPVCINPPKINPLQRGGSRCAVESHRGTSSSSSRAENWRLSLIVRQTSLATPFRVTDIYIYMSPQKCVWRHYRWWHHRGSSAMNFRRKTRRDSKSPVSFKPVIKSFIRALVKTETQVRL